MTGPPVSILLVEDDDIEAEAFERAARAARIDGPVRRAPNGAAALAILRGEAPPALTAPFLIVLDLRMPVMNGIQFLDVLRGDADLRDVFVIVVSSSGSVEDRDACSERGVMAFFAKSDSGADCERVLEILDRFHQALPRP